MMGYLFSIISAYMALFEDSESLKINRKLKQKINTVTTVKPIALEDKEWQQELSGHFANVADTYKVCRPHNFCKRKFETSSPDVMDVAMLL